MEKIKKAAYNIVFFWKHDTSNLNFGGNSREQHQYEQVQSNTPRMYEQPHFGALQGSQGQGQQAEERVFNIRQAVGKPFAMFIQALIIIHLLGYLRYSLPVLFDKFGIYVTITYSIFIIYLFICVAYNHYKACVTEPGYPERIATATGHLKLNFEKNDLRGMSYCLKSLINKRNKGFVALLNSGQPNFTKYQNQCFKCVLKPLKPHRSYHCSTCERDIIYMDHHCVAVNNCIGLNNFRYFLGLILYTSILIPSLNFTYGLKSHEDKQTNQIDYYCFAMLYFLDVAICFTIVPLTIWKWNLALSGQTSVEYTKQLFTSKYENHLKENGSPRGGQSQSMHDILEEHNEERARFIQNYRITSWRENIFVIFGTWNVFSALLIPAERTLPLRGLEWSFMNIAAGGQMEMSNSKLGHNSSISKKEEDTDQLL